MNGKNYSCCLYSSPLGRIVIATCEDSLCGLWFEGQKHFPKDLPHPENKPHAVAINTVNFLNQYFAGIKPERLPKYQLKGSAFALMIWHLLAEIPYGTTTTYGQIALLAKTRFNLKRVCPRAVGTAVGHNPISILIPCHRVLGAGGKLTGYAGGLDKKIALLKLEGAL